MLVAADPPIDPAAYSNLDLLGTVRTLGPWWYLLMAGLDRVVADERALPGGPTFNELATAQVTVLLTTQRNLGNESATALSRLGQKHIEQLAHEVHHAAAGRLAQQEMRSALEDLVVQSLGLLRLAGRTLAGTGAYGHASSGVVSELFTSNGGVPKVPVQRVEVTASGLAGDRQRTRRHHGRPWQAICLWSAEVIARLAAEGHPIAPGYAGENISVSGIDWVTMRPGVRLRIGANVMAEVSVFALPCKQNARWFRSGDFMRMHHEREPGVSRVYASVLHDGVIAVGDPVGLLP